MASVDEMFPADAVRYCLYPAISDKSNGSDTTDKLEQFAQNYIVELSNFLKHYIWHDGTFNLHAVEEVADVPPHLQGTTCYGDNVEDEWFIVYLLFQLTKADPELVIKMEDTDGEFLLIEAADYLPKWLNPETSKNRVYIYREKIHIIPVAKSPGEITPIPCSVPLISDALAAVRQFSSVTLCSQPIQEAIQNRIKGYPERIKEFHHKTHCFVPSSVAAILKSEPHHLSTAVKAFYLRDPIDLKACRAMRYFPPETRVMTEVLFTKCLYAQLLSQKYKPDGSTGWKMPRFNHPDFKSHDLGMKLACGFEILVSKVGTKGCSFDSTCPEDVDWRNDPKWKRFLSCLNKNGYFCGELEGSQLHRQLVSRAKESYLASFTPENCGVSVGEELMKLMKTLPNNYDEMKAAEQSLSAPDDDSWMDIQPEQLDDILDRYANNSIAPVCDESVARKIPEALKSFLGQDSSLEGVEVPTTNTNKKKQRVNLDSEAFSEAVSNILDFRLPESDGDEDSSSLSGYSDDDNDDSDLDLREEAISGKKCPGDRAGAETDEFMKSYLDHMDHELAQTNVGNSFERKQPQCQEIKDDSETDNVDDDFQPVDVDLTALKNILESFSSQSGLPGPAGNLFNSLGIPLPRNSDD